MSSGFPPLSPPVPHRTVGRLILVFADRAVYSRRPSVRRAALCAVSRDRTLCDLSRQGFNFATIQSVFRVVRAGLGSTDRCEHRGGAHRSPKGDNTFHLTVRVMRYPDVAAALATGVVDQRLVVSQRCIHVSFPKLYR